MKTNIAITIAFGIIILGLVGITGLTVNNRERGLKSATYNRFVACSLSIPPVNRTQSLINKCWTIAEKDTGVKVNHFQNVHE